MTLDFNKKIFLRCEERENRQQNNITLEAWQARESQIPGQQQGKPRTNRCASLILWDGVGMRGV